MKYQKVLFFLLVSAVLCSPLFATGASDDGTTPDTIELEIMVPFFGGSWDGTVVKDAWYDLMEKRIGKTLDLTWLHIPWGEYEDKVNISLAANDFPDMMYTANFAQAENYYGQGMFVELNEYEELIPNYLSFIDTVAYGKQSISDAEGKIYGFRNVERISPTAAAAPGVAGGYRFDIFEKHGIKIPTTTDEFYQAARTLKQLYPDSRPVNGLTWASHVPYAFHTLEDIFWDGEEYVYGPATENWKDATMYEAKMYQEGLLDLDHWTNTRDQRDKKSFGDVTFMFIGEWVTRPTEYTNNEESDTVWVTTLFPDNPKYGPAWQGIFKPMENGLGQHILLVNSQTNYPEICLQIADQEYTDEFFELATWGVEGESFIVENGVNRWMDSIANADNPYEKLNEIGVRTSSNQRPGLQLAWEADAGLDQLAVKTIVYEDGKAEWRVWETLHKDIKWPTDPRIPPWFFAPPISFSPDEREEISSVMTPVTTYVSEMRFKFIKGEESFENWDAFLAGMKKMGDYEKILKLHNDKAKEWEGVPRMGN